MKRKCRTPPASPGIGEVFLNPSLTCGEFQTIGLIWLVVNNTPDGQHWLVVGAVEEGAHAEHFILTPGGRRFGSKYLPVRMKWDLNRNFTVTYQELWRNGAVIGRVQMRWAEDAWRKIRGLAS